MKKKKDKIVAPKDESSYEVYEEAGGRCCDGFICQCNTSEYVNKLCDALEKLGADYDV